MFGDFQFHLVQHDMQGLLLALGICMTTGLVGAVVSRRIAMTEGRRRVRWCVLGGATFGFGIWATHFIAMLAWQPGFAVDYSIPGTILSLAIGCIVTGIALWLVPERPVMGGACLGLGIAAMHLSGMAALIYGGQAIWNTWLLMAAIVGGAILAAAGMGIATGRATHSATALGGGLMAAAICVLHFTAMASMDMSACFAVVDSQADSKEIVGAVAALAALLVLCTPVIGIYLDGRDQRRDAQEQRRLRELANVALEGLITCSNGAVLSCNRAFRMLTGHDEGAILTDVLHPAALETLRASPGVSQDIFATHVNGTHIPMEATLRLLSRGAHVVEAIALRDVRQIRAEQEEKQRLALARLETEQRFRLLVQSVTDYAIYMLDKNGHVANWNIGAERNKGYTAEEIVGRHFGTFFSIEDQSDGVPQRLLETAVDKGKVEVEGWRYRKDGTRFWALVVMEPIHDDDGVHIGFAKITHDNTQRRESAEVLRIIQQRLQLALDNMSQGLALFDEDGRLVLSNARLGDIIGVDHTDKVTLADLATGIAAQVDFGPGTGDDVQAGHRELWHGTQAGEMLLDFIDGRTILVVHRPVPEGGWVCTFEDVSERTRSERQIVHMARHDGLTGLPNRTSFAEHIEWTLDTAREDDRRRVAVFGIDLDRFKEINDHMGHGVGDSVLVMLAQRLADTLKGDEFIARFGGDEFAAYKMFTDEGDLEEFRKRLLTTICANVTLDQYDISVGASIGYAIFPEDGQHYEKLVANADMALYRAKASLDTKVLRYEPSMDEASRERQMIARDLWHAAERGQLYLHHQIQKSLSTGETTGYEVLLRWTHPERGPISPVDFIPVAEECGAILSIGEWVLRSACKQAAGWANKTRIAVNLSPVQLNHARFLPQLKAILAETGLEPWRLELEVTESVIITDKDRALRMLRQIKALGVTIAIDDFGTGYSSLDTLRSFPFDKIKLDRSFIREVETNFQSKAIIRAILALGRSLEVPVLAEGVETPAQLSLLRHEGCDEAQGYFLGRPGVLAMAEPESSDMVA